MSTEEQAQQEQQQQAPAPQPDLLKVKEVASALRLSEETIYKWVALGKLPVVRLGGSLRIERAVFDRLLAGGLDAVWENASEPDPEPGPVERLMRGGFSALCEEPEAEPEGKDDDDGDEAPAPVD